MTDGPDSPIRVLRSLPLAILLGTAASTILIPFLGWIGLLIAGVPSPPGPVWERFLAIHAVAGACLGAAAYAAARLPPGWPRWFLFFFVLGALTGGDVDDYAREPLDAWLTMWLAESLTLAVLCGTMGYVLERRARARAERPREAGA